MVRRNNGNQKRARKGKGLQEGRGTGQAENDNKRPRLSPNGGHSPSYTEHDTRLIDFSENDQTWYQYEKSLRDRVMSKSIKKCSKVSTEELAALYREAADEICRREIQISSGGKDERWIESTIRKGTLKDRIAAMSVLVSQDPVHKFHALDGLLQMACGSSESVGHANSRVAQLAAEALEDLFLNTLIPTDRKLQTLEQRTLPFIDAKKFSKKTVANTLSPKILLLWRFEEMVKEKFDSFVRIYLTQTLQEGLEVTKIAALRTAASLLRSVPEGESQILGLVVNKLGDPQRKTAAAAGHELRAVLKAHPNMQVVIAREVQQLAHRPHLSPRALYNCVAFLNQLQLDRLEETPAEGASVGAESGSLPAALITTYFKLFEVAMRASGDRGTNNEVSAKSRLLQALLIGVNRAHPYLPKSDQHMDGHIDELYRVLHTAPSGAATQALTLLFHIAVGSPTRQGGARASAQSDESRAREDRYYRALFAALSSTADSALLSPGKHSTMFFNVLYKSMKFDNDSNRVLAFAKRLLVSSLHCSAPSAAASIFVLNEVAKHHQEVQAYLDDVPERGSAETVLHAAKREPRAAFTVYMHDSDSVHRDGSGSTSRPSSWELSLASFHYHPSVSKFAKSSQIKYHGNPMQDFSLAQFLDKFAYRNPKAPKQRRKNAGGVGKRRGLGTASIDSRLALPVNDPSFLKQRETAVQDEFFRKFFAERASRIETLVGSQKQEAVLRDEDDALDYAESNAFGQLSAFENNWESDSEEEAFVDNLAQKLLVDNAGGAPVEIDEDPNMDDWGDLYSDDDDEPVAECDELNASIDSSN